MPMALTAMITGKSDAIGALVALLTVPLAPVSTLEETRYATAMMNGPLVRSSYHADQQAAGVVGPGNQPRTVSYQSSPSNS